MSMIISLTILLAALVLDRIIGDPEWLWKRIPHPVVLFGKLIGLMDIAFNSAGYVAVQRRVLGWMVAVMLVVTAFFIGAMLVIFFGGLGVFSPLPEIVLVSIFIAQKSLADHVSAVVDGLRTNGLAGGREAVSKIVGRDPASLDEAGVSRAAVESLAENFSDGVVAPVFWYIIFGLPGLLAYKMLNTADSMIGHHTVKYEHFGQGAAILDDIANWIPARFSAILVAIAALVSFSAKAAGKAVVTAFRDARLHRSPNAGWPEAAMAGALDAALAGPRVYHGETVNEPMINAKGERELDALDILDALFVFRRACDALAVLVGVFLLLAVVAYF